MTPADLLNFFFGCPHLYFSEVHSGYIKEYDPYSLVLGSAILGSNYRYLILYNLIVVDRMPTLV